MRSRLVRLIALAVAAVVAGTAAAAYSGSNAPQPAHTTKRLQPQPKSPPEPQPTVQRFFRVTLQIRVYPKRLRDLCRSEAESGAALQARQPPAGSSVDAYVAWLDEAARWAASLDASLRA